MDVETPITNEQAKQYNICWDDYVECDLSDAIEAFTEAINEKVTVVRYTKTVYEASYDNEVDDLDDLVYYEIDKSDTIETDETEYKEEQFQCECGAVYEYSEDMLEHVYEKVKSDLEALVVKKLTATQFLSALFDNVFIEYGEIHFLVQWALLEENNAKQIIKFLFEGNLIPIPILEELELTDYTFTWL